MLMNEGHAGAAWRRARIPLLAAVFLAGLVLLSSGGVSVEADVGDGGLAITATLVKPDEVAIGLDGEIYIADSEDFRVRRVGTDGIITTVAGTGVAGYSGDDGPASSARIQAPFGIDVGLDGSLYIADSMNYRIRRVDTDGTITTVAGTGAPGYSGDNGPALQAPMERPFGVAVDDDGGYYISDAFNQVVRYVDPAGTITTVAGTGVGGFSGDYGPATEAALGDPYSIEAGPDGSFYIGDSANFRVRYVSPDGEITTVAGDGTPGYGGDGGPATEAQIGSMRDVSLGTDGSLYIADTFNHAIRRVGLDGIMSTIAGTGEPGFSGDGDPAVGAELNRPYGVTPNDDGQIFIADADNDRVRRIGTTGNIQTVAGGEGEIPLPPRDSSISGKVTDLASQPLAGICVSAFDGSYYLTGSGLTDSSGHYTVGGLSAGNHKVEFFDCGDSRTHASEWSNDKPDFPSADPISVARGANHPDVNAALAVGGSISGVVTDGDGNPISEVCVNAFDPSFSFSGFGFTDSAGSYKVGGLGSGNHKLEFSDCDSPATHVPEWSGDQHDFAAALPVAVTQGADTPGIDVSLAVGGSVSGTVNDGAGYPMPDICVDAYDSPAFVTGSSFTRADGKYTIGGLSGGTHKVQFRDCDSPATHVREWSGDKSDFASADPVVVTQGSNTTGINASLIVGGSLSGVVITATGKPLQYVCVDAYTTPTVISGSGFTDASGHYSIGGLVSGQHRVFFRDCSFPASYASEWYTDKPDFVSANVVPVTVGGETTGISAILGAATPTPTGTPSAELTQGDVDCDGDEDSVDALKQLRHVAALTVSQGPGCPPIGSEVASLFGDVDCDGDVDSVDALKVLRHVAGLSVSQTEPCADIGTPES